MPSLQHDVGLRGDAADGHRTFDGDGAFAAEVFEFPDAGAGLVLFGIPGGFAAVEIEHEHDGVAHGKQLGFDGGLVVPEVVAGRGRGLEVPAQAVVLWMGGVAQERGRAVGADGEQEADDAVLEGVGRGRYDEA